MRTVSFLACSAVRSLRGKIIAGQPCGVWWPGDTSGVHFSNYHKSARTAALLASVRSLLEFQKPLRTGSGPRFLRPVLSSFQNFFFSEGEKGRIGNRKKEIRLLLNENFKKFISVEYVRILQFVYKPRLKALKNTKISYISPNQQLTYSSYSHMESS